jgi:flagellar protein FliS
MFRSNCNAAKACSNVGLKSEVSSASPHQLIAMLFEVALLAIVVANQNIQSGNVAEKDAVISKTILLIDSDLRGSLNMNNNGDLAKNLNALPYSVMTQQLLRTKPHNNLTIQDKVYQLLVDLKSAWNAITRNGHNQSLINSSDIYQTA